MEEADRDLFNDDCDEEASVSGEFVLLFFDPSDKKKIFFLLV